METKLIPRPFFVEPYFECPISAEELRRIPPHRLVIEPLVRGSDEICVFQKRNFLFKVPIPPHTHIGHRYYLDRSRELVHGWESFWNAGAWRRGAVTLRLPKSSVNWQNIFSWTEYGGVWSTRYQISKGTPKSAIAYCDKNAVDEAVVVCLSASNGIQWMDIWTDLKSCVAFDQLAQATCQNFVRECEMGKYPREIVCNTAPYRDLI